MEIGKIINIIKSRRTNIFKFIKKHKIHLQKWKIFMIFISIIISFVIYKINDDNYFKKRDLKEVREFVNIVLNNTLINPNEVFYKSEKPKISIVIAVYNGEGYIKTALLSVQNQDFKDVEITMVDDCSKDDSVNLIKKLMEKDPRIILIQNKENKGTLYTKTKGVLNAKGEYVMTLDVDDLYAKRNAFSILYKKAKQYNLDILWFSAINGGLPIDDNKNILGFQQTQILFQPKINEESVYHDSEGKAKVNTVLLWLYIYKTSLFKKIIKEIDDKFLNRKMIIADDNLLNYLLTKYAYNFMKIKPIFYFQYQHPELNEKKLFREIVKNINRENLRCSSQINFLEFLFVKTANTVYEKQYASVLLEDFFKSPCQYNKLFREDIIYICNKFLENKYIENKIKDKIRVYLNSLNEH